MKKTIIARYNFIEMMARNYLYTIWYIVHTYICVSTKTNVMKNKKRIFKICHPREQELFRFLFHTFFVVHTYPMLNRNTNKKNNIIAYNNNNKNYFL